MQKDLTSISPPELIEMLIKSTEYFMSLNGLEENIPKKKLAQQQIDLIVAEIKTRQGYGDVFNEDNSI